jgi:hypothetical protein
VSTEDKSKILFEYQDFYKGKSATFCLTAEGAFYVRTEAGVTNLDWYKDQKTGKPWIVRKRKTFVSLVKQSIREGDFTP